MRRFDLILFSLLFISGVHAKVLIITHAFNRPEFIEIQYKTFQKFLRDDYEFVIFNDASSEEWKSAIISECERFQIPCIRVPQKKVHRGKTHPSIRHAQAIAYSLKMLGFHHEDILVFIDSDMILLRPFSFREQLEGAHICGIFRRMFGKDFLWPGLSFFRMDQIPDKRSLNFFPGKHKKHFMDTGWGTRKYLRAHKDYLTVRAIDMLRGKELGFPYADHVKSPHMISVPALQGRDQYLQLGFNEKEIEFLEKRPANIEFFFNHHFIHYRNYEKMDMLREFVDIILQD